MILKPLHPEPSKSLYMCNSKSSMRRQYAPTAAALPKGISRDKCDTHRHTSTAVGLRFPTRIPLKLVMPH